MLNGASKTAAWLDALLVQKAASEMRTPHRNRTRVWSIHRELRSQVLIRSGKDFSTVTLVGEELTLTGSDLVNLYEFTFGAIKRNLDGVANEDSLVTPQPGGNCMNWILGHVVAARSMFLNLAGAGMANGNGDPRLDRYRRGSEPLSPADTPLDLATLRGMLEDSQRQLLPVLAAMTEEALNADIPEQLRRPPLMGNVGQALARMNSHESYHNGQLGLLRRLVGKEGAIR
jgi:hypothetical protein